MGDGMADGEESKGKTGLWSALWRPSARYSFITIFVFGGVVFLLGFVGFDKFITYTNTTAFCVSCHEMEMKVHQEFKNSGHYASRTGVKVECSDCHVPKENPAKLIRKIMAYNDVLHTIKGTINTPEKFEAHRKDMAERVWAYMGASGSRECRSCHDFGRMKAEKQNPRAQENHLKAQQENKTCIDCHKGIAHRLPRRDD
jgi:cytochrome c-type protein NapC